MTQPSDEARYIYHERMGIGIDLGMTEEEAKVVAVKEAMEYDRAGNQRGDNDRDDSRRPV